MNSTIDLLHVLKGAITKNKAKKIQEAFTLMFLKPHNNDIKKGSNVCSVATELESLLNPTIENSY